VDIDEMLDTIGSFFAGFGTRKTEDCQNAVFIAIENRLFFYPKDVLAALQKKFKPTPDCDGWLHKVWNALRKEEREK